MLIETSRRPGARTAAALGLLLAAFSTAAGAQMHGCTFETATDRTGGELSIILDWDFGHSSCIIVSLINDVNWIPESDFDVHPLVGGTFPVIDPDSPITSEFAGGNVATVIFDAPGTYPYFCEAHTGNMAGVVYVLAPPPEETPLAQRYTLTGRADYFINGVPLAADTNANGAVDSLTLPASIGVTTADVPADAELQQAFLYWGGGQDQPGPDVFGAPDDAITLAVPGGAESELTADICYGSDGGSPSYDVFVCRADITARIGSSGSGLHGDYAIDGYHGRIADGGSDHASAALVLFYTDDSLDHQTLLLYDGLTTTDAGFELTSMDGFDSAGTGGSFAWYTLEGDAAGASSFEAVTLTGQPGGGFQHFSDDLNPTDNPMNSTVNIPNHASAETISLDVDRFAVTALAAGDTAADVIWGTGADKWWRAVGVLSVRVDPPPPALLFADGFEGEVLPGCGSNDECPEAEYCATGQTGACEARGTCELRPLECPSIFVPVCGCDGQTHANACFAAAAGVNIDYEGSCLP